MATVTVKGKSSGVRVRARIAGGSNGEVQTTNSNGIAHFDNTANRVQVEIWSNSGGRWVSAGDVIEPFNKDYVVHMPF